MKYARTCSVTGKGMNEGWVWFGGDFYTSTQEITIAELRQDILDAERDGVPYYGFIQSEFSILDAHNPSELLSMTDDELLQWAFDNNVCFWTEWED